jgi:hypothetical protein
MISMKNDKIIASWNKIEPNDPADERMLSAILERNHSVRNRKDKANHMSRTKRKLVPAVICLAVLIAITGIIGGSLGWFGSKVFTVKLASGDSIVYRSGSTDGASFAVDYPVISRELTDTELDMLFPASTESRSAIGTFRDETGALLRVEGKIGNATVIYAQDGFPVSDVVIAGNETASSAAGVPVTAGYCITKPNSRGEQLAIFFGSFKIGDTNAYVEYFGDKSEADEVSQATAELILQIIENGEPDLSAVNK